MAYARNQHMSVWTQVQPTVPEHTVNDLGEGGEDAGREGSEHHPPLDLREVDLP